MNTHTHTHTRTRAHAHMYNKQLKQSKHPFDNICWNLLLATQQVEVKPMSSSAMSPVKLLPRVALNDTFGTKKEKHNF